ncbi:hypothetical protein [Williamsia sterculiae]|uniref:Uncharacterized protein n=1 Tax=Williamsia sterculiae TaxID=1344003 RepID=A0A1N7FTU2_9NOCA|nr:hypothetical protein [Williamsia sterculiae]SIS03694.1 hypothetical protein SAMN05445060_2274 [Williamsia sterculiae]
MTTTFPEPTRTTEPLPVDYAAPLVTPGRGALYAATDWPQDDAVPRWLTAGLAVRRRNYGLGDSVGIWGAD